MFRDDEVCELYNFYKKGSYNDEIYNYKGFKHGLDILMLCLTKLVNKAFKNKIVLVLNKSFFLIVIIGYGFQ